MDNIISAFQVREWLHLRSRKVLAIGKKAAGVAELPVEWTPPFIVVTTKVYSHWQKLQKENGVGKNIIRRLLANEPVLNSFLSECDASEQVIIRSSAALETILERGRYSSARCTATVSDITRVLTELWSSLEESDFIDRHPLSQKVAFLIQRYIEPIASGHLSNERRVSRSKRDWLCEFEKPQSLINKPLRFSFHTAVADTLVVELACRNKDEIAQRLQSIAFCTMELIRDRCHYEWLWDGTRIWIVQRDREKPQRSDAPGMHFVTHTTASIERLQVFRDSTHTKRKWNKIEALKTFKCCGLPTVPVYILEEEMTLKRLVSGYVPQRLKQDLHRLLEKPLVIRTDVNLASKDGFLLPRSDTLLNLDDAVSFMVRASTELSSHGLNVSEYCFIAHRFVAAHASALSYAEPNGTIVKIDAIWGLPDGLLFYDHDSFEVITSGLVGNSITKHVRCKVEFLDVDKTGKWIRQPCGVPWDWRPSLTDQEIAIIARITLKIANHMGRAVAVMFFAGIPKATGHPECIPWYLTTSILPPSPNLDERCDLLSSHSIYVGYRKDLKYLESRLMDNSKGVVIRLKPGPEFITQSLQLDNS
jgi:hypothetical protein